MNISIANNQYAGNSSIIGQTYGLLGIGLVIAAVMAYFALGTTFSLTFSIVSFIGSIVLMFGAFFLRESVLGLLCYFGFTAIMGYIVGPTVSHYLAMPNGSSIVLQALGITAIATVALSIYAFVSGRSFS